MNAIAEILLDGLFGGTVLFALTYLVTRIAFVRSRPALVFALWLIVLLRFALPLSFTGSFSLESLLHTLFGESVSLVPSAERLAATSSVSPAASGMTPIQILIFIGVVAWGFVTLGLVATTAHGAWKMRRFLRALPEASAFAQRRARHIAARLGLRRCPRVVLGAEAPLSFGIVSPIVALPRWVKPAELDHVLAHELAHVARRDPLWATIARLTCSLLFFWPPVWLAARCLATARETACDRVAVAACDSKPSEYARTLLSISALVGRTPASASSHSMAARPSELAGRVNAVLTPKTRGGLGMVGGLVVVVQILIALPGAAGAADTERPWPECVVLPGLGAELYSEHPEADRDGDGVLSKAEICAFQEQSRSANDFPESRERLHEALAPICMEELRCSTREGNGEVGLTTENTSP